jgi:hypothetical protein
MAARDDSVIRGSLIACMIFLVLSLALNWFFYQWGDTQAKAAEDAKTLLNNANGTIETMTSQATLMKAMLGQGGLTQAELDRMRETTGDDPVMAEIEARFVKDMAIFGTEVPVQDRNYPKVPEYLINAMRQRTMEYNRTIEEREQIKSEADADVAQARDIQKEAEGKRDDAEKRLVSIEKEYIDERARINLEKEQTRDELKKKVNEMTAIRQKAAQEKTQLEREKGILKGTIATQKTELNELRSDQFETTQGEVRYVGRGGKVVTINLGAADQLRAGVTFGVIDGTETRIRDAKVKATIQVTKIQGDHLAEARVVAEPEIKNPIIPGDLIYSPFWAPGRTVKIALAGFIDIDGDDRPDNEEIKGMITAAGAEVVAEISPGGAETGKLDASVRFLVVGEAPEGDDPADIDQAALARIGDLKQRATELGLTIIPAWKLQNYLQIMNDKLTTPLGSAVRGEDFPPEPISASRGRLPTDISEMYKTSDEGMQKDNKILPP